ncbi:rare lipoprotein A-like double-psi beta-barrel domain containing protein [Naviculisporaceae sp. PSN 640]
MFAKTFITAILAASASLVNGMPTTENTNVLETRDNAPFNAKLTWYYPGLGACGETHGDNDLVVAVDKTVYGTYPNPNDSPQCGRRLRLNYSGRSIVLTVVDMCPSCPPGGLDLTPAAWKQLVGDLGLGPQQGTWDWA